MALLTRDLKASMAFVERNFIFEDVGTGADVDHRSTGSVVHRILDRIVIGVVCAAARPVAVRPVVRVGAGAPHGIVVDRMSHVIRGRDEVDRARRTRRACKRAGA